MTAQIVSFPQSSNDDEFVCLNPGVAADMHRFLTLLEACVKAGHPSLHTLDKAGMARLGQLRGACERQYNKMTGG